MQLCRGRTSSEICAELGIARNTLRTHVQKIINKLNVNSRLEAVALAQREGIV
jgi:DNA-binding CsgD family transcriptional regulator